MSFFIPSGPFFLLNGLDKSLPTSLKDSTIASSAFLTKPSKLVALPTSYTVLLIVIYFSPPLKYLILKLSVIWNSFLLSEDLTIFIPPGL